MDWSILICLILLPLHLADNSFARKIEKILKLIKRRYSFQNEYDPILEVPRDPSDLPEAEPIHPGHTLLRPALGMLKSSVKFPQKDSGKSAVYGNLDNLGITYGKTPYRIRYSDFRKRNEFFEPIPSAVKSVDKRKGTKKGPSLVILVAPSQSAPSREYPNYRALKVLTTHGAMISEEDNDASEIVDKDSDEEDSDENNDNYRRNDGGNGGNDVKSVKETLRSKSRFRKRSNEDDSSDSSNCTGSTSSSSSESDSDFERNSGNPYTVFKDKYKQNWLWNHFMDGDHMNINPYGPQFTSLGPSGAELILGRKWWYFNQDDYKPFR